MGIRKGVIARVMCEAQRSSNEVDLHISKASLVEGVVVGRDLCTGNNQ